MSLETPENVDYILGDNKGYVSLIQHVGDDTSIVNSARVSFGKQITEIEEKDRKLIKYLLAHEHGTPLEHNSLTFLVKCPIFIARQWLRHRIASYNEISYRYVEATEEFYIPAKFREQSQNNRQASIEATFTDEHQAVNTEIYQTAVSNAFNSYQELLKQGVAREQARGVLPLTTYTQYYFTCNLRSFLHFVRLRSHEGAQWEIQQYANSMLKQAKEIFPHTIEIWEELQANNSH